MNKSYYFENKFKKWSISAAFLIIMGGWFWYMLWASSISHETILQKSVPEWGTYFLSVHLLGSFL